MFYKKIVYVNFYAKYQNNTDYLHKSYSLHDFHHIKRALQILYIRMFLEKRLFSQMNKYCRGGLYIGIWLVKDCTNQRGQHHNKSDLKYDNYCCLFVLLSLRYLWLKNSYVYIVSGNNCIDKPFLICTPFSVGEVKTTKILQVIMWYSTNNDGNKLA